MRRDEELEEFKARINLSELAAAQGYVLDPKESSAGRPVMRGPGGDKINLAEKDGRWVYYSFRDLEDNGSVVDFVKSRDGRGNLGAVRKILREWLPGGTAKRPAPGSFAAHAAPAIKDIDGVAAQFAAMAALENGRQPYLNEERLIPASLLAHPRFAGRVRADERGNAVFPHFDRTGVTGFERVNHGFRGFARGGEKGLWCAGVRVGDTQLVLAESAIDALSYATIHGFEHVRHTSLAGQVSPKQIALVGAAIERLAAEIAVGEVVLAFDNDEGGERLTETFTSVFEDAASGSLSLRLHPPPTGEFDWNDELQHMIHAGEGDIATRYPELACR